MGKRRQGEPPGLDGYPSAELLRQGSLAHPCWDGRANYFKHAVAKHTLRAPAHFAWWRVVRWLRTLHRWKW